MAAAGKQKPGSDNHIFLPEDLMIEIMVRLPVKSLLRFKTLCKFWLNLIENKDFIQNHFELHSNDHPRLLVHPDKILNHDDQLGFSNLLDETLDNLDFPLDFSFYLTGGYVIIGPVNGLFLLSAGGNGFHRATIFNPATRQFNDIEAPSIWTIQHCCPCDINFGFGYDSTTDDFKVIAFPEPGHAGGLFFHVYSLANDSWTQILDHGVSAHDQSKLLYTYGSTYFNGTFHWLFKDVDYYNHSPFSVLSFDISNQTFDVFDGPENPTRKMPLFFSRQCSSENDNYLLSTLFYWPWPEEVVVPDHSIHLMVMKNKGRWEKSLSIDTSDMAQPAMDNLGVWKDNRVLFKTSTNEVRFYDIITNEIQELGRIDKIADIVEIVYYKGSLVSVKGGTNKQKATPKVMIDGEATQQQ